MDSTASVTAEIDLANATAPQVFHAVEDLIREHNRLDHQLVEHISALDRLGVARRSGTRTKHLLIEVGLAPAAATRLLRLSESLGRLDRTARHFADGVFPAEHTDAIARGVAHVERRVGDSLTDQQRADIEIALLSEAFAGGTPARITERARALGNELAQDDPSVLPPAEDRSLNTVDTIQTTDGRLEIRADVDVVVGEKFMTLIDAGSAPRPEPDGSPDARTAARRRADALEMILDRATAGTAATEDGEPWLGAAPKTEIMMTLPVDTPDLASLQWLGPVSRATVRQLSCDAKTTDVILDGQGVPLDVGRGKRICPPSLRKAVILRDGGACIKCGAPAAWAHIHHMQHWSDGGMTSLDNLCVLCPACHADVHSMGWEIRPGYDRHPWLVPPAAVDPRRRPLPAHHRKRMNIDDLPVAS